MTQKSKTVAQPSRRSGETGNLPGIKVQQDPCAGLHLPGWDEQEETALGAPMCCCCRRRQEVPASGGVPGPGSCAVPVSELVACFWWSSALSLNYHTVIKLQNGSGWKGP